MLSSNPHWPKQKLVLRHNIDNRFQTLNLKIFFVNISLVKGFKVQDHSNTSIRFWPYKNFRNKIIRISQYNRFKYYFPKLSLKFPYLSLFLLILTPTVKFLELIFRNNFFILNFCKMCLR